MDPATILVLFLCAGVVALLIWFEINSLRNEDRSKAGSVGPVGSKEKNRTVGEPKGDKRKAA